MKMIHAAGRFVIISALTLAAAFSVYAPAFAGGLTRIADGVYSYVDAKNPTPATSFGANAGIIIGKDGIAVVDTLTSAKEAQRFIKDIRSITDQPIKYVINTHHHLDHSLGNSEFVKLGAAVIAQENCRREAQKDADTIIKRALNYGFTAGSLEGTTVVLPTLTFTDTMTIDLGDRTVELIYHGPSHTNGSALVLVPEAKVLFAGDALFTNFHPNMRDADVDSWIKSLDRIAALDVQKIIPGHGPVSSRQDIGDMKKYLLIFDAKAGELSARSHDPEYIASELKKALPRREYFDLFIAGNVKAKYLKEDRK
jgi:glyoxylase-like metal-dependent hydrolase (beta-lactamase superfamily II)